jgi:methyltransferase-like protein
VLKLLDGGRDQAGIVELIVTEVLAGRLNLQHEGQAVTDATRARELLGSAVGELLKRLVSKNLVCPDGWPVKPA